MLKVDRATSGIWSAALVGLGVAIAATSYSPKTPYQLIYQRQPLNLVEATQLRSPAEVKAYALKLVNQDRAKYGLPPLAFDPIAERAAQFHAEDMLQRGFYAHVSPEGKNPMDRYRLFGGDQRVGVGENIDTNSSKIPGLSYELVKHFEQSWMNSPGHRQNILNLQITGFGYGIAIGPTGRILAVQKFSTLPH